MTRTRSRRNRQNAQPYPGTTSQSNGFSVTNRALQPFPPRFRTKMVYADTYAVNLAAGIPQDQSFRLNSTFDPDLSGAGHQPTGRDTLVTLYNRYRVLGAKWRVCVINADNSATTVTVVPNNTSTSYSTTDSDMFEQSRAQWMVVRNNPDQNQIEGSCLLHQLDGVSMQEYLTDDRFQALGTTNPVEQLNLHVVMRALAASPNFRLYVAIEYDVEWFDPIPLAQS